MEEQLTLRSKAIDKIVNELSDSEHVDIAETIEDKRGNYVGDTAIGICGFPGAGKTHVAEILGEVYDAPVISMGDAIRAHLPDEARGSSEALGEFAAETRAERAETIPEWTADLAMKEHAEVAIIDGVRSVTDYEVLNGEFDDFYLFEIQAPFYVRLHRIKMRNREGEGTFTPVSLAERDERELYELGYAEMMSKVEPDVHIDNDSGPNVLTVRLREAIHEDVLDDLTIVNEDALSSLQ